MDKAERQASWITSGVLFLVVAASAAATYFFWGWVLEDEDLTTIMRFVTAWLLGGYAARNLKAIWR